jgi:hypothetical protein
VPGLIRLKRQLRRLPHDHCALDPWCCTVQAQPLGPEAVALGIQASKFVSNRDKPRLQQPRRLASLLPDDPNFLLA